MSEASRAATSVDLQFAVSGRNIPAEHAWLLQQALFARLPWLADDAAAGVFPLQAPVSGEQLLIGHRARLVLRLPRARLADARDLTGAALELGAGRLEIGAASERELMVFGTLYAELAVTGSADEGEFFADIQRALAALGVATTAVILGKQRQRATGDGKITGWSVLLHGVGPDAALLLQETGLGKHRTLGCGLFVPHKSIKAVWGE